MKDAIFLDRDGTIIKDCGFINNPGMIRFYRYTFDCLRELQKSYILFIITNQPGVARGIITKKETEEVHTYILHQLKKNGIEIKEIFCCPHIKEDMCPCRKPATFFFDIALNRYKFNPENSYVIGDHPSDIEFAINANASGIYLLTGHGRKHYRELDEKTRQKIRICQNLEYATRYILERSRLSSQA